MPRNSASEVHLMDVSEVVKNMSSNIPCRKAQIQLLISLFGQKQQYTVPSIFLYGHTATGKSLVVNSCLEVLQLPYALVNCVECYSQRLLFEHILNQVSRHTPSQANGYTTYARCDNSNDFVRLLKRVVTEERQLNETLYIVLDKAERIRDMNANILPAFLRLQELTGLNVCTILVSEIVWDKFRANTGFQEPLVIHFSDYSKNDLQEILSRDCPREYPEEVFHNYISLVLSIFHLVCRNLNELRHLALLNFPKYVEPINLGEATVEDSKKLWRNIEPHLKKALQTVYLREISSAQWERLQQEWTVSTATTPMLQEVSSRANIELPFYSKYMLIAAYLASYNPAKSDRRFFSKRAPKMSKKGNLATIKKNERTSSQLLGPKPFQLDRMMAIFYSIVDTRVAATANIFSQISSLVTLGLLAQLAGDDQLDAPRYKCLVSLEFIKGVARTVTFDITRYLYDFV